MQFLKLNKNMELKKLCEGLSNPDLTETQRYAILYQFLGTKNDAISIISSIAQSKAERERESLLDFNAKLSKLIFLAYSNKAINESIKKTEMIDFEKFTSDLVASYKGLGLSCSFNVKEINEKLK